MAGSKDRSGSKPGASDDDFDGVWEAMAKRPGDASEGSPSGTKAWSEEVRGARKRDRDRDAAPEEDEVVPATERTVAWTEESRGARKRDLDGTSKDEMARWMAEAPPASAPEDDDAPPPASTSMVGAAFVETPPAAEPASDAMAKLMGAPDADDEDAGDAGDPAPEEDGQEEQDKQDEEDADDEAEVSAPIPLRPRTSEETATVAEPATERATEPAIEQPGGAASRAWLWVAAAVVAGGVAFATLGGEDRQPGSSAVARSGVESSRTAADAPRPNVDPPSGEGAEADAPVAAARPKDVAALANGAQDLVEGDPPPTAQDATPAAAPARTGDPRQAPPGTPPEIVEVFKKIPVSAADKPPVGGIGATGVHVDDIAMGTGYARSRCEGESTSFSVADAGQANVCLRVVHQRQKEELVVVWQKRGGHARRGKIVVKGAHAYRTRAYLKLRSEYVGEWDVKILSADGVELATQQFSIVP